MKIKFLLCFLALTVVTNKFYAQTPSTIVDTWGEKVFTPSFSEFVKLFVLNDTEFKNELIKKGYKLNESSGDNSSITFSTSSNSFICSRRVNTNTNHTFLVYSTSLIKDKSAIPNYLNGIKRQILMTTEDTSVHHLYSSEDYFIKKNNSVVAIISFSKEDYDIYALQLNYPPTVEKKNSPDSKTGSKSFKIDSETSYTTVPVSKGDIITITASGRIVLGTWAGSGGPEGIDGYTSYNRVQGFRHGSLLVRIGDNGTWETVGSSKKMTANSSGLLQFMVNDQDPSNNSGSFIVDIAIKKP